MLTPQDHANLLAIITSPQLTITAQQAEVVVALQYKLRALVNEANKLNTQSPPPPNTNEAPAAPHQE